LAWRIDRIRGTGLVFGVEAHLGSLADTPEKAEHLIKAAPGLTLTLDYTHFTKTGTPDSEIEPLIQYASHFHARGAAKNNIQVVFKENTIDYRRILQAMKQTGYAGYIGIEYVWMEWENCNRSDNLSESILLRDYLRSCDQSLESK
jgi:sugar phosphate isomerase/epimerase